MGPLGLAGFTNSERDMGWDFFFLVLVEAAAAREGNSAAPPPLTERLPLILGKESS